MIPLLVCNKLPRTHEAFTLPSFTRSTDWFGSKLPFEIRWSVACDRSALLFCAVVGRHPTYNDRLWNGIFAENLWEQDVVELFIAEEDTTRYQEFNLSPAGAWWTGLFDNYRQRDIAFEAVRDVETYAEVSADSWKAAIRIPTNVFAIKWEPSRTSRMNVTSIVVDKSEQTFISWMTLNDSEPDFHRTDRFELVDRTNFSL